MVHGAEYLGLLNLVVYMTLFIFLFFYSLLLNFSLVFFNVLCLVYLKDTRDIFQTHTVAKL